MFYNFALIGNLLLIFFIKHTFKSIFISFTKLSSKSFNILNNTSFIYLFILTSSVSYNILDHSKKYVTSIVKQIIVTINQKIA